jgi:UDP-N-acetylmuramyl pentapeptide phosphotransferase/UDP-N-acetylglucosamine-1-phosphate transferase
MLWYSLISFLIALLSVFFIRRYFRMHAQRYAEDAPQRFHHGAVSRLGGPGIFFGWAVGVLCAAAVDQGLAKIPSLWLTYGSIIAVVLAVVTIGALEDYTQSVSPRWRLVLTAVAASLSIYALNLTVPHLNVPFLDLYWKQWPMFGVLLAFLGLIGLTHAFNLIDGYNGLAGLVAVLIGLSYAYVSFKLGDRELFIMAVCVVAATLGFLVLNYPRGLIFAGDGGAYFWGFTLALIGILLVQRHPQVSPWYPLLLLIYPIWETVFSTYRKLVRGQSPGMADALHLHQLVYRRLVKAVLHEDEARVLLSRNNRTTPYLVVFTTFAIVPATLFWKDTGLLILSTVLFAAVYCAAYVLIVRFKVPRWLQK